MNIFVRIFVPYPYKRHKTIKATMQLDYKQLKERTPPQKKNKKQQQQKTKTTTAATTLRY